MRFNLRTAKVLRIYLAAGAMDDATYGNKTDTITTLKIKLVGQPERAFNFGR